MPSMIEQIKEAILKHGGKILNKEEEKELPIEEKFREIKKILKG